MLRSRKVLTYIVEKLELDQPSISSINSNSAPDSTVNKDNGVGSVAAAESLEKTLSDAGANTDEGGNEQETSNIGQSTITAEERNSSMKPELWLELVCQDQVIFHFE
jgi:hypothetical protein